MYILETIYMGIFNVLGKILQRMSQAWRERILTLCFMAMMLLFLIVRILHKNELYPYYFWIGNGIMLLIALCSIERPLRRQTWNPFMAYGFLLLGIAMTVSDFLVEKVFFHLGLIFIFGFMAIAFIWMNHSNRERLWDCFFRGMRYFYLLFLVYSFLFRPRADGMRYAAGFVNPNMLGLYLILVCIVYLRYLDDVINKKASVKKSICLFVEMGLGIFLLYMTQARTSMLDILFVGFVWFAVRYVQMRKERRVKRLMVVMGILIASAVICIPVGSKLLEVIPDMVNHPADYDSDILYPASISDGSVALAADVATPASDDASLSRVQNSLKADSMNELLNGRTEIYKTYLHNLNFEGHRKLKYVDKKKDISYAHAHNNVLQFAYTYGYVAMVLYIVVNGAGFILGIMYYLRRKDQTVFAVYPLLIVVGFSVASLVEAILLPYQCIIAFAFYLALGELMQSGKVITEQEGEASL